MTRNNHYSRDTAKLISASYGRQILRTMRFFLGIAALLCSFECISSTSARTSSIPPSSFPLPTFSTDLVQGDTLVYYRGEYDDYMEPAVCSGESLHISIDSIYKSNDKWRIYTTIVEEKWDTVYLPNPSELSYAVLAFHDSCIVDSGIIIKNINCMGSTEFGLFASLAQASDTANSMADPKIPITVTLFDTTIDLPDQSLSCVEYSIQGGCPISYIVNDIYVADTKGILANYFYCNYTNEGPVASRTSLISILHSHT
jgi:hypothetical protein